MLYSGARRVFKKTVQRGRSEQRRESYSAPYVAPLSRLDVHYAARGPLYPRTVRLMLVSEGAIKVEGGTDQCEVGESLREIPQRLPAVACFLGVETEMVGIAEHALK